MPKSVIMHRVELDEEFSPPAYFAYTGHTDNHYIRVFPISSLFEVKGIAVIISGEPLYECAPDEWYQFEASMKEDGHPIPEILNV